MKKLLLIGTVITSFTSCSKEPQKQCVCKNYAKNMKEEERVNISEDECRIRELQWKQVDIDIFCKME